MDSGMALKGKYRGLAKESNSVDVSSLKGGWRVKPNWRM